MPFDAWLRTNSVNKLVIVLVVAIAGAILTKLIPTIWGGLVKLAAFFGALAGGRLAFRSFQGKYLNWLVVEQRELKLTGIVTSDESKKRTLEKVFVSWRVDARG